MFKQISFLNCINSSTNVQRIVSGVVSPGVKSDVGTFTVKYSGLPVSYDTTLHILDTDYDSFAVVWSCSSLAGPVGHTGLCAIISTIPE